MRAAELSVALGGRPQGAGWIAPCPLGDEHNNSDRNPSLTIVERDGKVLVRCQSRHASEQDRVIEALKVRGLWPAANTKSNTHSRERRRKKTDADFEVVSPVPSEAPNPDTAAKFFANKFGVETCERFDYRKADGARLFCVYRFEPTGKAKEIRPFTLWRDRTSGKLGWRSKWPPAPLPLYGLDRLAADPDPLPVLLTEGEKKTDRAAELLKNSYVAVSLPGGAKAIGKVDLTPLAGRRVMAWPDNDRDGFVVVAKAARLIEAIEIKREHAIKQSVQIVTPDPTWPVKYDIADLIEARWTVERLSDFIEKNSVGVDEFEQILRDRFPDTAKSPEVLAEAGIYRETLNGLIRVNTSPQGTETLFPLTNFRARIVADITRDDGAETTRSFGIDVKQGERATLITIPVAQFPTMRWPVEALGSEAVVYAGQGTTDHTRCAIQLLSSGVARRTTYTHTGWREIDHQWIYLHAGGAIGAAGRVEGVEVSLPPELAAIKIELPIDSMAAKRAITASLRLLDVGPDRITVPGYGAFLRAIIGFADFSVLLYGPTGVFKTELSALIQQHFGAGFDSRNLPTSFTSTANTNEALAFAAKDAVLVVDELHPPASGGEREAMHRDAARLLRSQGNRAGRGRMRSDGTLRAPKPPRGLVLATGEELPRGQSVHARLFTLEIQKGEIDAARLTACQHDAAAGLYAQATSAFIKNMAANYGEVLAEFERLKRELRGQICHEHARTSDIRAQLTAAFSVFIAFLVESDVIDANEAERLQNRVGTALEEAANAQAAFSAAAEPTGAFIRLLTSAIAAGRAHLADPGGGAPESREAACGWRQITIGTGDHQRDDWQAQSDRVGWIDDDHVFLNRDAAYRIAQGMAADGAGVEVSVTTLTRRLRDRRLLLSVDSARETLTIRRVLEGKQHDVLHVHAKTLGLFGSPQPDNPDIADSKRAKPNGRMSD